MITRHSLRITGYLEKIAGKRRPSEIFDDWLDIVLASLLAVPRHVKSMMESGTLSEDTPEAIELFATLRQKYSEQDIENMAGAFGALLDSAGDFSDTIGDVYMEFGHPVKAGGQYFTPFPIAKMMAAATMNDVESLVHDRIKAAIAGNPLAESMLLAGCALDKDDALCWLIERILPLVASRIDPVKVSDPACGSGVMLLAAASMCPRWMLDCGLIQFYGQDIDSNCVKMAKVNMLLHGLHVGGQ